MINILVYLLAFVGIGCFALKLLDSKKQISLLNLAEGFFVGVVLVLGGLNLFQLLNINLQPQLVFWFVFSVSIIMLIYFAYQQKSAIAQSIKSINLKGINRIYWLIGILFLLDFIAVIYQNINLPLTPWDSWSVWVAKSKIWFFQGLNQTIVNESQWLTSGEGFANEAAHYPEGLSLLYWFLSGFTGWYETQMNPIYISLYICLLYVFFANLKKSLGLNYALIGTIILTFTPLLKAHVVLAGYADIWVTSLLIILFFHIQNSMSGPLNYRKKLLILFYLASLFLFKLEAILWALVFVASLVILNRKRFKALIALFFIPIVFVLGLIVLTGFQLELGFITINSQYFLIGDSQPILFEFQNSMSYWATSLFNSNNWNLLWYTLPIVLFTSVYFRNQSATSFAKVILTLSFFILFIIFNFTSLSLFAKSFTAINRLLLQVLPIYIFLLLQSVSLLNQKYFQKLNS